MFAKNKPACMRNPMVTASNDLNSAGTRLASIDALRGLVIVIMFIDHLRDYFFSYLIIDDPINVTTADTAQFVIRLFSSVCAPMFVLLTGISAYLYGQSHSKREVSTFLLKRGLFLMLLELTVVNTAWTGKIPPDTFYLQVIWAIGLSMVALSLFIHLPKPTQWLIVLTGIAGHNVLDGFVLSSNHSLHTAWSLFHQRDWIMITDSVSARTSYPLLPWPCVMLLGYQLGKVFEPKINSKTRQLSLAKQGLLSLAVFFLVRTVNVYGDKQWTANGDGGTTLMSFFALTKYPPSLLFLLFTLGVGLLLMACIERWKDSRLTHLLVPLGTAPMFFYILHLYLIGITYLLCVSFFGANHGERFGFDKMWQLWTVFAILMPPLYYATLWFGQLKQRRKDIRWLKYF
ncbi:DUF1624 domain-containing protein [Alteromonas sp. MMG017]|uniref:DUF1624 domain-containing protein n=1 Tax=Alteromonas sp. MMG017 TaxID=2822692 RepID=UPI001B3A4334|nr:heparan-alpha-glucosaminide N-acetyltransferase domain-containing protein [Alteromonas sp. MMG017]MBQ4827986.1 DUF1624 domain-containing protein [Alteromonas sp. MMG017]